MSNRLLIEDDPQRPPLSVDEVLLGLMEHKGNLTAISEQYERPRWVVEKLINETPQLLIAQQSITESRVDKAEKVIDKFLDADDFNAARLVATTQGRNRGWTTRTETTGKDGGAVIVKFEGVENDL